MPMLIRKALRSRPVRFWLAAAGVGVGTLLVLVLGAAYRSVSTSVAAYVGQRDIDLWVAPIGTDNLMRSSALLPVALADSLLTMSGVAAAQPVMRAYVTVKADPASGGTERRAALIGIGYLAPDGRGGPPAIVRGDAPQGQQDVALDRAAAHRLGVTIGDTVWVNGRPAVVRGLTSGTNLLATQFIFVNLTALSLTTGLAGRASFIVVQCAHGAEPTQVAEAIRARFPNIAVFQTEEFVDNNSREIGAGFIPLLALIGLLGISAAAVLVALLVHAVVEEGRADIAVLLALGAETTALAGGVIREAAALVAVGGLIGTTMAFALGTLLERLMPVIPLTFHLINVLGVLLVFAAAGIAAAVVPILRLRRVDPLEAFRP